MGEWGNAAVADRTGAAGAGGGAVYGLGLIGAAFYYIQHAATFMAGVVGILKAIVWPAFVVYHLLGFLGMSQKVSNAISLNLGSVR